VTLDVAQAKKRMMTMLAVDAVCVAVAVAAAVGSFAYGIDWLQWLFAAALLAGFGAQVWFIAGFRRTSGGS
jgi:hypothetical protein